MDDSERKENGMQVEQKGKENNYFETAAHISQYS